MAKYGYIDIPNAFFKGKISASSLLARASVYSLSSSEREQYGFKKKQNRVKFTVSSFANRYNVSTATSRRALASLDTLGEIDKTEEGMFFSADKMKDGKKGYLHVEEWMFFATFAGEYLTKSEVLVLARLLSLSKKGETVKASYRYVARGLGLSHTLVMNAVEKLERIGVLNIISRAHNRYDRTVFVLQKEYIKERKTDTERKERGGTEQEKREKYYGMLRQVAKTRQSAMFKKANTDARFRDTYKKWYNDKGNVTLQAILFERLEFMGMSWGDIQLRHKCARCQDTGTLQDGNPCGCYDTNN